jgi:hypothetical protein
MTHDDEAAVYSFNQENLLKIIGDPAQADVDMNISACEICRAIPDVSRLLDIPGREISYGGYPPAFAHLEDLIEVSDRITLKRCPRCGRLYEDRYDYEYLAGGSEDEYTLTRLNRQQALALLAEHGGQSLVKRAGKWVVE